MQFTDEEIETIKEIICEHGSDCPYTDSNKILALQIKLGLKKNYSNWSPEDAARRMEFKNSPFAQQMSKLFADANSYADKVVADILNDKNFFCGEQWDKASKIGSELRIRLPIEYNLKNERKGIRKWLVKIFQGVQKIYR